MVGDSIYHDPYSGFALDQDTGGAIRAPGRCDIYLGQGDDAGKLAGQTYKEGRLYYLFLKPEVLASIPSSSNRNSRKQQRQTLTNSCRPKALNQKYLL